MKIKKQLIISWLLSKNDSNLIDKIRIAPTLSFIHLGYLKNGLSFLEKFKESHPIWDLPVIIMPSFEEAMKKSAKSFYRFDHKLFQDFYKDNEYGIVISKEFGTIVYGFGENILYIWAFLPYGEENLLYLYFHAKSTEKNTRLIYSCPSLTSDPLWLTATYEERERIYECLTNFIINYLAVKKYAEVEKIVIPAGSILKLDDTILPYKTKEKIKNDSGQEVIVMDSRWFRKIINDNDIFVRGFFRFQNRKDINGKWYKTLIFIDPHIRHGYHRNAIIEEND